MEIGEDLSCFSYKGKVGELSPGSAVCHALRLMCKKAVLRYGHAFGCFWGVDLSRASEELKKESSLSQSSSLKRSAGGKPSESPRDLKHQHSKKKFSRSHCENGGGKDDSFPLFTPDIPVQHVTDLSELILGQKFASGSYSKLYQGLYKQQEVAVKIISPPSEDEVVTALLDQQFSHEVALLSWLHHCNIIEFVSAWKQPPMFCIITQYLAGGSLKSFLHKTQPYSLPLELVISMAVDTASGMEYLHFQGMIHRDLKSDNLIMTKDLHIKIADFGVSCLEIHKLNMKDYTGTYRWMAPEMIKEKPCSRKVDVYSFGIVLWELLTCLTPYGDMSPVQAAFAVSQKNARPPLPLHCPSEIAKLMKECWSTNPADRPEFCQIVDVLEGFQSQLSYQKQSSSQTVHFLNLQHLS